MKSVTLERMAIVYTQGEFYYLWLYDLAKKEEVDILELEICCMEQL